MPSLLTKFTMYFLSPQLSGWSEGSISEQRDRQEKSARFFRLPKQVRCQAINIDGISSEWFEIPLTKSGTILYLHGGAYALGYLNTHRSLVANLVKSTHCSALAINYRLAPENPFPAALEDTLKAYDWLLSQGISPSQICIAGDSAGGGLAIAALLAMRDNGLPLPAGAFCFSPWLDLTLSGNTMVINEKLDPLLSSSILEKYVEYYRGAHNASDPLISPLFADLQNLPSIYLQSGRNEILLDDSTRFCEKARQAGVDVSLNIFEGMFHVFQLFPFLSETAESINQVGNFLNRIFHK